MPTIRVQPGEFFNPMPDGRTNIPRRFNVIEKDDQGHEIELEVEVDQWGQPRCRRVTVLGGEAITGETLRSIPIARALRLVTAQLAEFAVIQRREDGALVGIPPSDEERRQIRSKYGDARRPRRGSPVTEDNLRAVAEMYRDALRSGVRGPTQAVAKRMHVSRSTAGRWVSMARERGLLGAATPGARGERGA